MAISQIIRSKVKDFGSVSSMPTFSAGEENCLFGFLLSQNITVDSKDLVQGSRCFGYYGNNIAHCIIIPNGSNFYTFRYVGGSWTSLGVYVGGGFLNFLRAFFSQNCEVLCYE